MNSQVEKERGKGGGRGREGALGLQTVKFALPDG